LSIQKSVFKLVIFLFFTIAFVIILPISTPYSLTLTILPSAKRNSNSYNAGALEIPLAKILTNLILLKK